MRDLPLPTFPIANLNAPPRHGAHFDRAAASILPAWPWRLLGLAMKRYHKHFF